MYNVEVGEFVSFEENSMVVRWGWGVWGGTGEDAGGLASITDGCWEAAAVTKVQLFGIHFIFIILII